MKHSSSTFLSIMLSVILLVACQSQSNDDVAPFDWADAEVTSNIEVSPRASKLSIQSPALSLRGISIPGVPQRVSVQKITESDLLAFLAGVPSFKGQTANEIRQHIQDGHVSLSLSYVAVGNSVNGTYSSKTITLQPNGANLSELDITLSDLTRSEGFVEQAVALKNQKGFYIRPQVRQSVSFMAADRRGTTVTTTPSLIVIEPTGSGQWRLQ
jgi:hypothetical protein